LKGLFKATPIIVGIYKALTGKVSKTNGEYIALIEKRVRQMRMMRDTVQPIIHLVCFLGQ
jgi:hypothetical protein